MFRAEVQVIMNSQSAKKCKSSNGLGINMKFNEDFNPSNSKRSASKTLYDGIGRIRKSGLDACDCLSNDCIGCHFPCSKCKSPKCGNECRTYRNDYVRYIQINASNPTDIVYNSNFVRDSDKKFFDKSG